MYTDTYIQRDVYLEHYTTSPPLMWWYILALIITQLSAKFIIVYVDGMYSDGLEGNSV